MTCVDTNEKNRARLTGQAGVYRVASELLLRGFNPRFPAVDCGVDLEVDGGIRIQVKAAHLRYNANAYPQGAYWFKFWNTGRVVPSTGKVLQRGPKVFSTICDFVVLWGVEQGRFWVVHSATLDNVSLVIVGPDIHWVDIDLDEVKRLYEQGLDTNRIAEIMGVHPATIRRRNNGLYVTPTRSVVAKVRICEGKWNLIQEYLSSLQQAESAATCKEQLVSKETT